jgi:hypothetical protein
LSMRRAALPRNDARSAVSRTGFLAIIVSLNSLEASRVAVVRQSDRLLSTAHAALASNQRMAASSAG